MGAHESTHISREKSLPAGTGRGEKRPAERSIAEHGPILTVIHGPNQSRNPVNMVRSHKRRSQQDSNIGSSFPDDIEAQAADITNRGRVAYMKAVKKARHGGKGTKPYKIPHDAIVNSMMKVESILAGIPTMPVFGKQVLLSTAKAESAQANTTKHNMRRSISERVVSTTESPPNNRIRDQMRKEKLINEQMRTKGDDGLKSRTQSFILPRSLHVIPEQPEEESREPENYSYSDINVYF